jgi:hypothetical protein
MIAVPNGTFIGDDSRTGVYVMSVDAKLTEQIREHLRAAWDTTFERAGMKPPVCLVLEQGITLSRLEPADCDHLVPGAEFCAA